jgi:[acyl-carrier-protein] S-malonyltransferase
MGKAMHDEFESSRRVFDQASLGLGRDVRRMCWELDNQQLTDTANAQPAILAVSIACLAPLLEAGVRPVVVAGLSLGEYSALVAAGSIELAAAMRLVSLRARLMQNAVPRGEGAMAAVIGLSRQEVIRACGEGAQFGTVEPANFNAPDQIVISGNTRAVQAASDAARRAGARKVVPLAVSAPFHCSLLRAVEQDFSAALGAEAIGAPQIPVVANVSARAVSGPGEVRQALLSQISSPVLWEDSVGLMSSEFGCRTFVEVGPGRVLSKFVNRIDPGAVTLSVEGPDSLRESLAELKRLGRAG